MLSQTTYIFLKVVWTWTWNECCSLMYGRYHEDSDKLSMQVCHYWFEDLLWKFRCWVTAVVYAWNSSSQKKKKKHKCGSVLPISVYVALAMQTANWQCQVFSASSCNFDICIPTLSLLVTSLCWIFLNWCFCTGRIRVLW